MKYFSITDCTFHDVGEKMIESKLVVYSHNVSCDVHSHKLVPVLGHEFSFESRIRKIAVTIKSLRCDVIALNEIRYDKNVELTRQLLEECGYQVRTFYNNKTEMSFHNIVAVLSSCQWEAVRWSHKWLSQDRKLSDVFDFVEGDEFGRCVGIVHLRHLSSHAQVRVACSHVRPFDPIKSIQQDSLFALSTLDPSPVVIVGDVNRFDGELEMFARRARRRGLKERDPGELLMFHDGREVDRVKGEVGTFTPWCTDEQVYTKLMREPLHKSRLDAQLFTRDRKLITSARMVAVATMMSIDVMGGAKTWPPPSGVNKLRHRLDRNMTSDHMALVGTYHVRVIKPKS